MKAVIDDDALLDVLTNDIQNGFGYSREESKAIAKNQAEYIIECMWAEYVYTLDHLMKYYEDEKRENQ